MAKFGDDKKAQKDGSLMNEMFLEGELKNCRMFYFI